MKVAPLTLLGVLERTTKFLAAKGVPDARLDAQYLLSHGLGMKRLDLYLNFDRPLGSAELEILRPLVKRRGEREPLQHILGTSPFRKLELRTDARALVPRPETEQLVDIALDILNTAPPSSAETPLLVAEVGVGSGAIILSLAKEFEGARYWGGDISPAALQLAGENAGLCALKDKVQLVPSNLLDALPPQVPPWLVVSNPPYIAREELACLQPEVQRDPLTALDGGSDGLDCIRALIKQAGNCLRQGGYLLMEIGHEQGKALLELGKAKPWSQVEVRTDYQGNPRFALLRKATDLS